jgi:hypothetical protein
MDAATLAFPVLIGLIAVALVFDFLNGLHDAANSIATVVATRVLRPQTAVVWAAFFNFIAFAVFGLHVAQTVGYRHRQRRVVDSSVIFGALTGAIVWNVITWNLGIPSSSSHALIGGLTGAAVAKAGFAAIVVSGLGITALGIVLVAAARVHPRAVAGRHRALGQPAGDALCRRPQVPCAATVFRGDVFAGSRRQRCAKDDGHSLRCCCIRKVCWAPSSTSRSGW